MLLDTPVCDFGWKAIDVTLPDLDGHEVSMARRYGPNGFLVAFICNHCPYVKAVIDRLVADATALAAEGINTLAVMPNDFRAYPDDRPEKMKAFAAAHKFPFPYLLDEESGRGARLRCRVHAGFFRLQSRRRTAISRSPGRREDGLTRQSQTRTARRHAAGRRNRQRPRSTNAEHGLFD